MVMIAIYLGRPPKLASLMFSFSLLRIFNNFNTPALFAPWKTYQIKKFAYEIANGKYHLKSYLDSTC